MMEDLIRSDDEASMMEHLSCHSLEDITAESEYSWKYSELDTRFFVLNRVHYAYEKHGGCENYPGKYH